jgi:glycerophosphoryl diester phosphodiesterase
VIAHRGGAALAAENTVSALEAATAAGADAIETDVRLTRDGILVCVHDADLMRLCNDPRAIADLELPTLRRLLPGIMTLRENPLGILLDVKLNDECGVAKIIDEIQQADAGRRAIIGLRSLILIAAARARTADIAILAFLDDPDAATAARAVGANWVRLWQGSVSAKRVDAVRQAGMRLAVMVGQPRITPLPEYPPFPVGVVDSNGLAKIAAIAPDAILLDNPRLMTQGAVS